MALPPGREVVALLSVGGLAMAAGVAVAVAAGKGWLTRRRGTASAAAPAPGSSAAAKKPAPRDALLAMMRALSRSLDSTPALLRAEDDKEMAVARQAHLSGRTPPPPRGIDRKFDAVLALLTAQAARTTAGGAHGEAAYAEAFETRW